MIEIIVAFALYYFDAPTIFWVAYCLVILIEIFNVVMQARNER